MQPYKKHIHNVVDALIFIIMSTIYSIIVIQTVFLLLYDRFSEGLSVIVHILYSLPLLCLVAFIICWILNQKTNCIQKLRRFRLLSCVFQDGIEVAREYFNDFVPDRLLNPNDYKIAILASTQHCLSDLDSYCV